MDAAWKQKWEYNDSIFNALLYFASEEGTQSLPNGEESILAPLAGAVVEYLGGDTSEIPYEIHSYNHAWWQRFNDEVAKSLSINQKNLDNPLKTCLDELLKVTWKHDRGESWWVSGVRPKLQFRQRGFDQTFSLTHPEVIGIQENIKSKLTPSDIEHCRQIGLLTRKNILAARAVE